MRCFITDLRCKILKGDGPDSSVRVLREHEIIYEEPGGWRQRALPGIINIKNCPTWMTTICAQKVRQRQDKQMCLTDLPLEQQNHLSDASDPVISRRQRLC